LRYVLLTTLLVLTLFLSACSQKKPLYYYGNYSDEYYQSEKELSHESQLQLQKAIEEAIQNAPQGTSGRVAPGLYANLGYLALKESQNKKAIEYFEKEKALYPESAKFMNRMIQKIQKMEEKEDDN